MFCFPKYASTFLQRIHCSANCQHWRPVPQHWQNWDIQPRSNFFKLVHHDRKITFGGERLPKGTANLRSCHQERSHRHKKTANRVRLPEHNDQRLRCISWREHIPAWSTHSSGNWPHDASACVWSCGPSLACSAEKRFLISMGTVLLSVWHIRCIGLENTSEVLKRLCRSASSNERNLPKGKLFGVKPTLKCTRRWEPRALAAEKEKVSLRLLVKIGFVAAEFSNSNQNHAQNV